MEPVSYSALKFGSQNYELAPELKPAALAPQDEGMTFKELMGNMIDGVNDLQQDADQGVKDLMAGRRSDVHNVAIMMDESGVAFDLMLQIRNKMLDGFKELSQMQA